MVEKREAWTWTVSPGDGTRYELTLVQRPGGGWLLVAWSDRVAIVRPGLRLETAAGRWTKYDRGACERLLRDAFVEVDGVPTPRAAGVCHAD